jgi:Na+/melibiose symporter-like transporter
MTQRLTFLPVAIVTALIAIRLDLTYVGFAILAGIVIPIVALVRGRETFASATPGYTFVVVGFVLLILAYFVCNHYGISFEALDHDRSFPKAIRRLPYLGIAFLTAGVMALAISNFRQQRG